MASRRKTLVLTDIRGGINQVDPPTEIAAHQMVDARNVETSAAGICRKRQGCAEPAGLTYSMTAGKITSLFRHTPADETATELWALTDAATPGLGRMTAASTTFSAVTVNDAMVAASTPQAQAVSFNRKLYLAADNAQDRLHVWDGTSLRRVGIKAATAAPTTATGAGSVTDTRKYRVTFTKKTGATIDVRSEPSPATNAVTLSAQKCTVTKPASPGDSETHWELWGAADDTNYTVYYYIGEAAVGTTTIEDNLSVLSTNGTILPEEGWNALPLSVKHILADDSRLVFAGAWEQPEYASRVWFTPALGASNIGDDERVPNTTLLKYYIDVNPGSGGGITGIGGPMADAVYVFKQAQLAKLVKTGVATTPYRQVVISRTVGSINAKSIVMCEDETGAPALYFLSRRGPYRIGPQGLEYLGMDIEPTWASVNLDATTQVAHGVYHHRKHQIWWWVATGSSNTPNLLLVRDTRFGVSTSQGVRGGWHIYDGSIAAAMASVMYAKTLGQATLTYDQKPYISPTGTNNKIYLCDKDGVYSDLGVGYKSWFTTKAHPLGGYSDYVRVNSVAGVFKPEATSSTVRVRAQRDFGDSYSEFLLEIPVAGSPTRVVADAPDALVGQLGAAHATTVQFHVYDGPTATLPWQLDAMVADYAIEEGR